jgi:hypothetical protein
MRRTVLLAAALAALLLSGCALCWRDPLHPTARGCANGCCFASQGCGYSCR